MLRVIHLLLALFVTSISKSQSPDTYVHQLMQEGHVPGVFVAVVKQDSVLFQKGFGVVNIKEHLPVSATTCMELGSISKAFADEIILYLQRGGLLQLDDPITKYLPGAPATWSSITIRHLMEHSSGIQNYLLDPRFKAAGFFNYSPSDKAVRFLAHSQNFNALTSRIFFNADLAKHDTTIISAFKSNPGLSLEKKEGWTIYPPNIDIKKILPYETFSFSAHPYFPHITEGYLELIESKDHSRVVGMSLSLSSESRETFDSVYKNIKRLYSSYSSRVIKRPNIAHPYEETKYLSKNGKDYVIISNGESDNRQHIYIAYNWQGYEW